MKKTACFFVIFVLLFACNNGNRESGNNEHETADTTSTESFTENYADIAYTDVMRIYFSQR